MGVDILSGVGVFWGVGGVLLLTCNNALKFDWYCKLSGSESNSLNLWEIPDRFSYSLETKANIKHTCNNIPV